MAPLFQETAEHLDGSRHGDIREWQDHKANDRPFSTAHQGRQPGPPGGRGMESDRFSPSHSHRKALGQLFNLLFPHW